MKELDDVLGGRESNHLLPFFWQHGQNTGDIEAHIDEILAGGCRALCVESRPHPDFCGPDWWRDMDMILRCAKARGMKVWILDDDHFPTGHANGIFKRKYPSLTPRLLTETHADVIGGISGSALLIRKVSPQDRLLSVCAYKQSGKAFADRPVDLTDKVSGEFLYPELPEGFWRVCFVFVSAGNPDYIDFLRPESTDAFLEAVYEPHYAHYSAYFGDTLAGFFSDEPAFSNGFFDSNQPSRGFYEKTVGMPGVALPYSEKTLELMRARLGDGFTSDLPSLWYDLPSASETRYAYMDAVTRQYSENFTQRVGAWCRRRGVMYIGHIIEDMNASSRLGCSAGHYFRAERGQDMAGIDVVLHQVMPGFAGHLSTGSFAGGECDTDFFHYVLPKLASSAAHIDPSFEGRAMCEVFGAYGWVEGTKTMKWLIDYLLVRGINYFVPHAFSDRFPDHDCPPHFGLLGRDPEYKGFAQIMTYANKTAHLLCGAKHVATAALLYHAEGEWCSREDYTFTEAAAVPLYDAHIDFDILPADALSGASAENMRLTVNGEAYDCLVVPHAKRLPPELISELKRLSGSGVPVIFTGAEGHCGAPVNYNDADASPAVSVRADALPAWFIRHGFCDLRYAGTSGKVRHYHARRGEADIYMFVNESVTEKAEAEVTLRRGGDYVRLDAIAGEARRGSTDENGTFGLSLAPYESAIYIFDGESHAELPVVRSWETAPLELKWEVMTRRWDEDNYKLSSEGTDGAAAPDFGGYIKYVSALSLDGRPAEAALDLGEVSQCASVKVNGEDCGLRVCPPYRFDISKALKPGLNSVEVEVSTDLARAFKDSLSSYMLLEPSGMSGPVKLLVR